MTRKKILVVDDNPVVLKALSTKLTASGYEVLAAGHGSEALGFVRREQPDLILLDISLQTDGGPGGGVAWDGLLLMDWLRRGDQARQTPFIIITGAESADLEAQALAAGAVAFFQKPVDNDELLSAIQRALEERETTGT